MQHDRPILIAGGGIGGLAAALGLAQRGFAVTVLEKADTLGEIGAGTQLAPTPSMRSTTSPSGTRRGRWRSMWTGCA